jgi:hypothetical protein
MFTRSSLLALAAVVALGASALTSTEASARFGGFSGGMGHSTMMSPMGHTSMSGFGHVAGVHRTFTGWSSLGNHKVMGIAINKKPPIMGIIKKPFPGIVIKKPFPGIVINKNWCSWHPMSPACHGHPFPPIYVDGPPVVVGGGVVSGGVVEGGAVAATQTVATGAAEPCNCLTKTYLQDGSVLFKDVCTKEAAIATPDELKAEAQGQAPQAN